MAAAEKKDNLEVIDGRYEVVAHLGAGGMGAVYRAIDRSTDKEVALKRILGDEAADPRAVVRFQGEFHSIARLQHPHIVEVYDYGVDPAGPYYTMEVLDGQDLRDMERPSPMEACRILRDVAVALSFLHSRRLLHRDLAPRNVRCTAAGHAKLIDFGLLATFGLSDEIAGTPPLIPPEMLRGLPQDHRADLYGLGGLAYWVLTGAYAYPARNIRELEMLWRKQPQAPSSLAPDIPPALDELVMSLMCIDPLGRPRTAAEVADRLSAIAQLDAPEVDLVGGYVASAALIGRDREMEQMRRHISHAAKGEGGFVLVNAPSGVGKSRLLRESLFEAQLAGATVVSASSDSASHGPYGLFREVARGLLAIAREDTLEAARSDAAAIAAVIPEMREPLAKELAEAVDSGVTDPAEERLRGQLALNRWILRIADKRPLAILIDDVQRCDEASLAVLAGLGYSVQDKPILIALALRSDETPRHPEIIATLLDAGDSIRLRGLELQDTEALVTALFGEVPRVANLARWMHGITGGSPLHLTEVAHYVVAKEIVSFHEGMWVLPAQSVEIEIPAGLTGAMDARIALLKPSTRALAESLSMHGGQLDFDLALKLDDTQDTAALFAVIDELMEQQILVGSSKSFRFRHDGLREALLRGLSEERKRELHLRVAEVLSAGGEIEEDREAEAGWHFLHGGDNDRGAPLLERAGRRLFEAQAMRDALAPLDAAIQDRKSRADDSYQYLDLLYMIVMAGAISDREVALQYMDETLAAYEKQTGITRAIRLGRFLGKHLALIVAIVSTAIGWVFKSRKNRPPNPMHSLTRFLMMAAHSAYIQYATNNVEGLRKSLRWLEPMNAFKGRAPHGAYESQHGMLDILLGRYADGLRKFKYGVHVVMTDKLTPTSDFEARYIEAAGRGFMVLAGVMQLDPTIDDELERIRKLDVRYFGFCARAGVALRHRLRGEESQAQEVAHELEVIGLQLGAGWHLEALLLTVSSYAYALSHDILGLKRCAEELMRLKESGFCFDAQLCLVRGEYHRERGEFDLAQEELDQAIELLDDEEVTIRQWARAAQAEVYMALGQPDAAREAIEEVLAFSRTPRHAQLLPRLRVTRTWALLEAGLGELEAAGKRLDALEEEIEGFANPVLSCLYHEAHARIALMRGDSQAYEDHCVEVAHAVNPTRNPALIAISERLRESLRLQQTDEAKAKEIAKDAVTAVTKAEVGGATAVTALTAATAATSPTATGRLASNLLSGCHGPAARGERALELLVLASSGKIGYLFVVQEREPVLAAPAYSDPPPDIFREVRQLLEDNPEETSSAIVELGAREWHLSVLTATIGARERVVGALAIQAGAIRFRAPDPRIVQQLARELYEAGDATAILSRPLEKSKRESAEP
jgi:tetratricopeptide (TPR) repeat protein